MPRSEVAAVLLVMGLTSCMTVPSDSTRFDLEPQAVSHLRSPQNVAIINTVHRPKVTRINTAGWTADFNALTETATAMLRRALDKRGIAVAPASDKKIALQVLDAGAGMTPGSAPAYTGLLLADAFTMGGMGSTTAIVRLGVQFADGTSFSVTGQDTRFSGERALDGAVLVALKQLVADGRFVAYVNSKRALRHYHR